jgi:hypothetical protein
MWGLSKSERRRHGAEILYELETGFREEGWPSDFRYGASPMCSGRIPHPSTALCNDTDPWCIYAPRAACQEDLGRKIGATLRAAFGRARLPGSTSLQTAISAVQGSYCGDTSSEIDRH